MPLRGSERRYLPGRTTLLVGVVCALLAGSANGWTIKYRRSFRNGFPEAWHVTKEEAGWGTSYRNYAEIEGVVEQVVDGDTLIVRERRNGEARQIDLREIDAPELGQAFGEKSRDYLSGLANGSFVRVTWTTRASDGTIQGTVWLDSDFDRDSRRKSSVNINLKMAKDGYAWAAYASRAPEYRGAMNKAKSDKRGLWSEARPVAPWIFRSRKAVPKHKQ